MNLSRRDPAGRSTWGGAGGVAAVLGACLVCCAGPVLPVLGGVAALSAVSALWIPALAVLAVAAAAGALWLWRRRRTPAACATPEVVDLWMPAVHSTPANSHPTTDQL